MSNERKRCQSYYIVIFGWRVQYLSNHLRCSVGYRANVGDSYSVQTAMVYISILFLFCGFVEILPTRQADHGGQRVKISLLAD